MDLNPRSRGFLRAAAPPLAWAAATLLGAWLLVSLLLGLAPDAATDRTFWERTAENLNVSAYDARSLEVSGFPLGAQLRVSAFRSFVLITGALLFMFAAGIPLGVAAATRRESRLVQGATTAVKAISIVPILVWAVALRALVGQGDEVVLYTLAALALAVGDSLLADVVRLTRVETASLLEQDFMRAVRARGASPRPHLVRGLLGPVVTILTGKGTYLLGGDVVVEYVFGIQGLGYAILHPFTVAGAKNYPFVIAATMLFVGLVVVMRLGREAAARASDPRLRQSPGR